MWQATRAGWDVNKNQGPSRTLANFLNNLSLIAIKDSTAEGIVQVREVPVSAVAAVELVDLVVAVDGSRWAGRDQEYIAVEAVRRAGPAQVGDGWLVTGASTRSDRNPLMYAQGGFCNKDFQLLKFPKQITLELRNEACTPCPTIVESGQDDDLIGINFATLPP